jgi:hypothetical protein
MSRLPDHLNPPAIKINVQRLACFDCGSETNATCTCGVAYLPKAIERVAEYDQANPGQSTRQAAADLGTTSTTVSKARRANRFAPETVTGRDGKSYPATKPAAAPRRRSEAERDPRRAIINQIVELFQALDNAGRDEVQDLLDGIRALEPSEEGS